MKDRIRNPDKDVCFNCGKWFNIDEMEPVLVQIHEKRLLHCKDCIKKLLPKELKDV